LCNVEPDKETNTILKIKGRVRKVLKNARSGISNDLDRASENIANQLLQILRTITYEKTVEFKMLFEKAIQEREEFLEKNKEEVFFTLMKKWDLILIVLLNILLKQIINS